MLCFCVSMVFPLSCIGDTEDIDMFGTARLCSCTLQALALLPTKLSLGMRRSLRRHLGSAAKVFGTKGSRSVVRVLGLICIQSTAMSLLCGRGRTWHSEGQVACK